MADQETQDAAPGLPQDRTSSTQGTPPSTGAWGLMVVAHGTVRSVDELPEFVRAIRRGRPAPAGLLEELTERYQQIGGSPLFELTEQQAQAAGVQLGVPAFCAMRLWHPLVEDVLREQVASLGLARVCVVPLAPFSVHVYREAAERAFAAVPGAPAPVFCDAWGEEPLLVEAHAAAIRAALGDGLERAELILTAHSLPLVALRAGDPYCQQFEACARAVERAVGRPCHIAYQSQGVDGGEWLGPSVEETLIALAGAGAEHVAIAPIGFLADHVETLYDLDVAAAEQATLLGLRFTRVPALNASAALVDALCAVARRALEGATQ